MKADGERGVGVEEVGGWSGHEESREGDEREG